MTEKSLEKSRNIFLSLTPPENLIPKKRVKASKKSRQENNRLRNLGAHLNTLNKFFHEKSHISKSHTSKKPMWGHLSLEKGGLIAPVDHSAPDELHSAIGGNINRFLKAPQPQESRGGALATPLLKKGADETELASLEEKTGVLPFFLRWNQGRVSLADFIRGRLSANIWKALFSSYDLNHVYNTGVKNYGAPIRIKNQHKNELMEYRKISIFYGNLSRNALTSIMRQSGGPKFLSTLERRLDVVLKRALFFPTIWAARQWVYQGKILVNHEVCMYNGYLLQPGDLISIKERYKNIWKREWFKNFKEFYLPGGTQSYQKDSSYDLPTPFLGSQGRFLFPFHVMRKWDKWCQLWGNSISPGRNGHPWGKEPQASHLSLHATFNNSVCADNLYVRSFMRLKDNLHKLRYTQRQSTPLLFRLEELYKNSFARKKQKHYIYQLISSLLLLQQRGRVVDGLFPQRWNRLFTKEKRKMLKKKNCQWGGIKPMHLECSYSSATLIYLFTPQKLVWPSHINVLLLKSALNG